MKKAIKILPILFLLGGFSNLVSSQNIRTFATKVVDNKTDDERNEYEKNNDEIKKIAYELINKINNTTTKAADADDIIRNNV